MAADANYAKLSVNAVVDETGILTFGIKEPTNGTTWLVFDNFRLAYDGPVPDGISQLMVTDKSSDGNWYDFSGRRISTTVKARLRKGIYVTDGQKIIIK